MSRSGPYQTQTYLMNHLLLWCKVTMLNARFLSSYIAEPACRDAYPARRPGLFDKNLAPTFALSFWLQRDICRSWTRLYRHIAVAPSTRLSNLSTLGKGYQIHNTMQRLMSRECCSSSWYTRPPTSKPFKNSWHCTSLSLKKTTSTGAPSLTIETSKWWYHGTLLTGKKLICENVTP